MFERYTEKARRCIFFARYEASQAGSSWIETGHLLLGMTHDDRALFTRLNPNIDWKAGHAMLAASTGKSSPTSVDLPLSHQSKRVLAYAAEESERLRHRQIESRHLLLGLLRETKSEAAEFLKSNGIGCDEVVADMRDVAEAGPVAQPGDLRELVHQMMRAKASGRLPGGMMGRPGGGGSLSKDEAGRTQGRISSTRQEDDWRVTETHLFHAGHEVTIIERSRLSNDGTTLVFSMEVSGPGGEVHQHTMNFPVQPNDAGNEPTEIA